MHRASTADLTLPRPQLLRQLHDHYYARSPDLRHQMSSHWEEYSKRAHVLTDRSGVPKALSGDGFGDLQRKGLVHRALTEIGIAAQLRRCGERDEASRLVRRGRILARRMGLTFTQDALRQVFTLQLLLHHLEWGPSDSPRILLIGDGYGFLSALIKTELPRSRLVLVDLGRTLLFQAYFCQRAHPDCEHLLVGEQLEGRSREGGFLYCPAERLHEIPGSFDLAVNVASMQEMAPETVAEYFRFLRERRTRWFYCCNRERKELPGGEVSAFASYPWADADQHVVDERCPWHQWFVGLRGSGDGPRLLGVRIPLAHYYDGPHRHRLTKLSDST